MGEAATEHGTDTPLAAASAAFAALNRGDWGGAAAFLDREDVEAWYQDCLRERRTRWQPTMEEMLSWEPDLPRDVAEYRLEQLRLTTELYTGIGNDFVAISTREELERLLPAEAIAQFLRAQDPVWRFDTHMRRLYGERPVACPEPPARRRQVVGLLEETGAAATVEYRVFWSDRGPASPSAETRIARLRRGPDGWRLRLVGEFVEGAGFTVIAQGGSALQPW